MDGLLLMSDSDSCTRHTTQHPVVHLTIWHTIQYCRPVTAVVARYMLPLWHSQTPATCCRALLLTFTVALTHSNPHPIRKRNSDPSPSNNSDPSPSNNSDPSPSNNSDPSPSNNSDLVGLCSHPALHSPARHTGPIALHSPARHRLLTTHNTQHAPGPMQVPYFLAL